MRLLDREKGPNLPFGLNKMVRRLVCSKSKQTNVDRRSREDAQSSNKSRFHSKFEKVKFNPNTDNNLHRSNVLFKRGNSSSYFRTNNQTSVRNRKYLKNGIPNNIMDIISEVGRTIPYFKQIIAPN
jgi:hypothetical protein